MREIKFRAWDDANEMMINPFEVKELYLGHPRRLILNTDRLMQYTGLQDRNGREIYEGDILIRYRREGDSTYPNRTIWVVEWKECQNYTGFNVAKAYNREVAGNIYENKELLV